MRHIIRIDPKDSNTLLEDSVGRATVWLNGGSAAELFATYQDLKALSAAGGAKPKSLTAGG